MKKSIFKLFKMALCVLFILSFSLNIPHSALAAPTDSSGIEYKQEYFYHWTKVVGNDNVADFLGKDPNNPKPIIIVNSNSGSGEYMLSPWGAYTMDDTNEISYINSMSAYTYQYFNTEGDFITSDAKNSFFAHYAGVDGYNAPKYYLRYPSSSSLKETNKPYMEPGIRVLSGNSGDRDTYLDVANINSGSRKEAWSITNDQAENEVPSGYVKIFNVMDGISNDQWMAYYPETYSGKFGSRFYNLGGHWSALDNFMMYVGNKISYSSINWNHTVQSGQVLTSKDNIMVTNDATITIEKGAVLSVSGQLFNNGTIINHGTIVLQDNSCINSMEGKNGSIINDGGDIVMLKGSKLYIDSKAKLTLKNGSTLVNSGMLIVESKLDMTESTLDIRENGSVYLGSYVRTRYLSRLKNVPVYNQSTSKGNRPTFNGLVSDFFSGYDINDEYEAYQRASYNTMLIDQNVEIINSGFLHINSLIITIDNKVNYTQRKNGRYEQTDKSKKINAQIEMLTTRNGYRDTESLIDYNNKNNKFWAIFKPQF